MKYIAYCRKSTDEKDKQILSIDAQIDSLKEYAKREKLEIVDFITEAKTAKAPGREKFAEVLRLIEKGVAGGILSWHPDRLARNSVDGGKIIYLLDTGKLLDLKFPTFWCDNTPQGKFMLNIAFGQSKYYVDNLSQNVVRGMRYKVKSGVWPGQAPYGYLNDAKTRGIEVDREKARIVKKAFLLFAEGNKSFFDIANFMQAQGITAVHGGKKIKITTVKTMLSNRFYVGIMKWASEYYEGNHKQFISRKLFDEVQKQIEKTIKPQYNKHKFYFCGLIKCRECGASITAERHTNKYKNGISQLFTYYRCTKKLGPCNQKYVEDKELENQFRKAISAVGLREAWRKDWCKLLEEDERLENISVHQNTGRLELELVQLDEKLNKLLDGYLEGVIDGEIYKQKKNELFEEKLRIQEDLGKIKTEGSSWLESFREFSESAFSCAKTARAKNTGQDLVNLAKTVGSNFFLDNRRLSLSYKQGFDTIHAEFTPHPNSVIKSEKFSLVSPERFERSTQSLKGFCSTIELRAQNFPFVVN